MKILIVGFGISGIYAASSLKSKNLDIISSDVNLSKKKYNIGCGKVNQWGGILYHFSKVLFFSFETGKVEELESRNISSINKKLKILILRNKGILFKARSRWFNEVVQNLKKTAKFDNAKLISLNNNELIFDKFTIKTSKYDKIFILLDHISMLKVLQKSAIIDLKVYLGNHYSTVIKSRKIYDTHYIKGNNLKIERQLVSGENNLKEYRHTIPTGYGSKMEEFIRCVINKDIFGVIKTLLISMHQKWFWITLISFTKYIKLSSLVGKDSLVTKLDRDIKPSDKLLSISNGKLQECGSLEKYEGISHEYGLDKKNLMKVVNFLKQNEKIVLSPSLFLQELGPANLTLPLLQVLEEDIKKLE
jgi:hypothetical protein